MAYSSASLKFLVDHVGLQSHAWHWRSVNGEYLHVCFFLPLEGGRRVPAEW